MSLGFGGAVVIPRRGSAESAESYIDRLIPVLEGALTPNTGAAPTLYDNQGRIVVGPGGVYAYSSNGGLAVAPNVVTIDTQDIVDAAINTQKIIQDTGIETITINSGGTGYAVGDAITFTETGASGATGVVSAVSSTGVITAVAITNQGEGYSDAVVVGVTSSGGSGADLSASTKSFLALDEAIIGTAQIGDGVIVTAKIGEAQIVNAKIADLAVNDAKIANASVSKLTAGTILADGIFVGGEQIELDGTATRIIVRDDQAVPQDRVVIGRLGAGTTNYGITIYDASGNVLLSSSSGAGSAFILPNTQVTGLGDFSTLDQITSGNVSTYIASAAIQNAQINSLAANKISAGSLAASVIYTGTLSANQVNTGTLDASVVNVTNLNASNITTGTLNAGVVNVTNLNASNINTGTLSAIDISGVNIDGAAITGGTITGTTRIAISAAVNTLSVGNFINTSGYALAARCSGLGVSTEPAALQAAAVPNGSAAITAFLESPASSGRVINVEAQSTVFTGNVQRLDCVTAATSSFNFLRTRSSSGGSPDTEHLLTGDGNGLCDSSWTGGGADYAEYFESLTGAAIPVGQTVVLDGDKVRAATESDDPADIMGVVRPKGASVVIGNAAWNRWHGKYLRDDYGAPVMEEYTVYRWGPDDDHHESENAEDAPEGAEAVQQSRRVLNPAYDPDAVYTPRSERPEWCVIGMMGQIAITKGKPVNPNWRKMKDISDTVELWLVR